MFLVALLGGCNGCRPALPPPLDTDEPPDTPPVDTETGETAAPVDTAPPPPCPVVEVEPNDAIGQAQELPLQTWACGEFDYILDGEWFIVTPTVSAEQTTEANTPWMTIQVEAASRGSSANPQILLSVGGESVLKFGDYLTTDPRLVFPIPSVEPYAINLGESDLLYGEDYRWHLMASIDKAPVSWDHAEIEAGDDPDTPDVVEAIDNDNEATAQPFPLGERLYGAIEAPGDFDWYKVSVTDVGEVLLVFDIDAYGFGSAADLTIWVYDTVGSEPDMKPYGRTNADLDSWLQKRVVGPADYYVRVRDQDDQGSRFHWYTLSITATPVE